jgi:molybdopterin converting factor small subunit
MRITVRFYSLLKEVAAAVPIEIDLPEQSTAGDLLELLFGRYPALAGWDRLIRVAAGLEYIERDHCLREGDVVSVMPPVQGG